MGNLSCKPSLLKIQSYKINRDIDEILTVDLNKINKENTKDELIFNFKNYTYNSTIKFNEALNDKLLVARVVDIYDGDTITCIINVLDNYFQFNVRLEDIDTCEIKSKNFKCKIKAHEAQNCLYELISNKTNNDIFIDRNDLRFLLEADVYLVNILCGTLDKYGRLLGYIFDFDDLSQDKSKSFNQILVDKKLAYLYEGKTKLTEEQQLDILS